jgi:uncharacterized integral membrane protein
MPVVNVGVMWMGMPKRLVSVQATVRLARRVAWCMFVLVVLVVFVMHMKMVVLHRLVDVFVLVAFGQVQPHTHTHQGCGHGEITRNALG